jgi:hypothetical protein
MDFDKACEREQGGKNHRVSHALLNVVYIDWLADNGGEPE